MMIFRILCGEWIEPLWDCMRAEAKVVSGKNSGLSTMLTQCEVNQILPKMLCQSTKLSCGIDVASNQRNYVQKRYLHLMEFFEECKFG